MNRSRRREEFGRSAVALRASRPFQLCGEAGANITDDAPQNKRQDAIDAISPSCALTELGIAGI
jgi:hypothetical protein